MCVEWGSRGRGGGCIFEINLGCGNGVPHVDGEGVNIGRGGGTL